MAFPIMMPRQGQSVETCIITRWLKSKGDRVKEGDLLFSYETDKAAFEETAEASGVLLEVLFEEGDEVPVLSTVAVVGDEGEDISEYLQDGKKKRSDQAGIPEEEMEEGDGSKAAENDLSRVPESDQQAGERTAVPPEAEARHIRISPRAKKIAEKHGANVSQIKGSGPNGRIIASDVLTFLSGTKTEGAAEKAATEPAVVDGAYRDEKLTSIRKIIAEKMQQSLSGSAQLTHHTSADARDVLKLRRNIKAGDARGLPMGTTLNDMVCYATVRVLLQYPGINAHFLGDRIRNFKHVHLGMAVDTERGLMVPVLRHAERYHLGGLGEALRELADACRKGTIDPDLLVSEYATFTISNLGVYDIEMFTPVLNLPQVGILGVNSIVQRPADMGDGTIGFVPHMGLSLTYDHRAVDGAPASRFLQQIKQTLESFSKHI